jgi:pimeloyl-ACP methyl ester carboxylesterase
MQSSRSFSRLATLVSDRFTVYLPDRRGRGLSGSGVSRYGMDREVEDLAALVAQTGTTRIFGLSSGALIALHAAAALPELSKVALYEPPLSLADSVPRPTLATSGPYLAPGSRHSWGTGCAVMAPRPLHSARSSPPCAGTPSWSWKRPTPLSNSPP